MTTSIYAGKCVFGLDIGTRSIVGTVGYQNKDKFIVLSQKTIEHETRAMMDGQIHDIARVGETIKKVKTELEEELQIPLHDVCIAAAGRVLRTLDIHVDTEYEDDRNLTEEDIYALNSKGVEKAYEEFLKNENSKIKFYCVGYSIVRYYLNDYPITNLIDHKARKIGVDLIATFLPNDVVDGLYKAVEYADLHVQNMTLEPIAAIIVAIPQQFRMLNIALVDVGAGTSDISITRDGSIVAYGMIPVAGDRLTETIAKHCLVDFTTAEKIKRDYASQSECTYHDIIGLEQTITKKELDEVLEPVIEEMAQDVADRISELNGDKAVSAVFVVGGGGKIAGYTEALAKKLAIQPERVALRGKEVMGNIEFRDVSVEKDSLLVTPVGICLSYYEQSNNFIFVSFNGERVKLYDNGKLAVVDAAMNADFPSDALFAKRGTQLEFTIDGKSRIMRGELGEPAIITVNGQPADIHTSIHENDAIQVMMATAGAPAHCEIGKLPEFKSTVVFNVNGKSTELPKFAYVNGTLQTGYYEIQNGDVVELASYYTVQQIIECMDVQVEAGTYVYVNNAKADQNTKVYENFSVVFTLEEQTGALDNAEPLNSTEAQDNVEIQDNATPQDNAETDVAEPNMPKTPAGPITMHVMVNQKMITLQGKKEYVFVDVFDYINFDLSKPQGHGIVTKVNGVQAQYLDNIHEGDQIDIHWLND